MSTNPVHALVVDGDPSARAEIEGQLQAIEGWQVEVSAAGSWGEAQDAMALARIDVVFLDYDLGRGSGLIILNSIREAGDEYPVIVLANDESEQVTADITRAGADDCLLKAAVTPTSLVRAIVSARERFRVRRERRTLEAELMRLASHDGLTGIPNRRFFESHLEKSWRRAMRQQRPISLILMDIDDFKGFNDSYGHLSGDDCLRDVARTVMHCVRRPDDLVARFGGEEFVAVLPDTDAEGAMIIAERMRSRVEDLRIPHVRNRAGDCVTISVGLSTCRPGFREYDRRYSCLLKADQALYLAKAQGRNQVAVARPVEEPIVLLEGD